MPLSDLAERLLEFGDGFHGKIWGSRSFKRFDERIYLL
jgi:hypothetical protein